MSKGGGSQQSSTTQTNTPWAPIQPYLKGGYTTKEGRFLNPNETSLYSKWSSPGADTAPQTDMGNGLPSFGISPRDMIRRSNPDLAKQFEGGLSYDPGLYGRAAEWFKSDSPMFYPGSTVAPMSPETDIALNLQTGRALSGSPLTDTAQSEALKTMRGGYMGSDPSIGYLTPTARGDYLNANPYLDQTFNRASEAVGRQFKNIVEPGIASRFAMGGRSGSGLQQEAFSDARRGLGETLGNMATDIYGGNYATERQNQLMAGRALSDPYQAERGNQYKSMLFAPSLAQQDYFDIGQLAGAGAERGAYDQQVLNADIERFNFGENQPLMKLQALNQLLQGGANFGTSTTTSSQPLYRNQAGGALGGALAGAQLGSLVPGIGTGIGAGIGGLLALLG